MNDPNTTRQQRIGKVEWMDLTVAEAESVCEFYSQVTGWKKSDVPVADYHDYCVGPDAKTPTAGICHARGPNADIPPTWMIYINVDDLDRSLQAVSEGGGKVLGEVREMPGHGRYCMIQDPAGAVCSLFEPVQEME